MKIFIVLIGVLFYFPILFYGFSQDDFIHINSSSIKTFGDFLNFFNPFHKFPDIFFFRPLSTQFLFFINNSLFGLNPVPYHVEALILHLTNGFLLYLIVKNIWKNSFVATLSALLYTTSAVHFLSLYYISAFQQILRTFFMFLSIYLYLLSLRKEQSSLYHTGSLLAFITALISKEISIILPFLLPLTDLLKGIKIQIKKIIPYFVIMFSYLVIRFFGFQSIFSEGSYNLTSSFPEILQNLKWYILWGFGLPEILSSYPSIKPSSLIQFTKDFSEGGIILGLFIVFLVSMISIALYQFKHVRQVDHRRILLISFFIFIFSLLPVLFLHQHKYPQYLDLAFLGVLPIFALMINNVWARRKFLALAIIGVFISLQFFSLKLSEQTHWTTKRSKIANYYQQKFLEQYPKLKENTNIALIGSEAQKREVSHALAGKYAFLFWYQGRVKNVEYLNNENEILKREDLIIYYLDKY